MPIKLNYIMREHIDARFLVQDVFRFDMAIDDFRREIDISALRAGLQLSIYNTIAALRTAAQTIGDMDIACIGDYDPYKLGEIANI